MKTIRFLSLLALVTTITMVGFTKFTWAQRTLYVPSEYPTIQEAIGDAVSGDTVQVEAGIYYENLDLPEGVSLIGAGAAVTTIDGQMNTQVIESYSSLESAKIAGFTITYGNGGGIAIGGPFLSENCTFFNNYGPGIQVFGSSPVIRNCVFLNNLDEYSIGGIYVAIGVSAIIDNCTFSNNYTGGAIFNGLYSSPTISNCIFTRNGGENTEGGAICNWPGSFPIITNCTFLENFAGGGGGAIYNAESSSPIITNCIFSGNSTLDTGGAIYNEGSPIITNCTFWGNLAFEGGGIYVIGEGLPAITNCIIWNNSPLDLMGYWATYSDVGLTDFPQGEGNISTDPQFINPAGGNFRLQAASPCIDTGSNSAPEIPENDLEGKPRFADGNGDGVAVADMGAYEFVHAPNTPVGVDVTVSFDSGQTVTFADVSISGETSISISSSGPSLPPQFSLGDPPTYYEIQTTAIYGPPVTVCINYDPTQYGDPNNLYLLHYEDDAWVDVTTSNDTEDHVICGEVGSLSLFVIAMGSVVYDFSGFFQPVENPPVLNVVNAGRAIPVKFSLNGDQGLDILAPGYPASAPTVCGTPAENAIEETVTAGSSSLSYDASTDEYIYIWKTDRGWASTCRTLILKLKDGTDHRADFRFK